MLTKWDVQKVRSQMTNELNASLRTVITCALLLLLLVGVSFLGAADESLSETISVDTLAEAD